MTKGYIPRVKKSSVKWKCEKEIVHLVHSYYVTGKEPRKNITYYKLASFVSDFPAFFKVSSIFLLYFHKWSDVHQKWCSHIHNITGKGLLLKPRPGPWTRTLKNLDPDKHGKRLDMEKWLEDHIL